MQFGLENMIVVVITPPYSQGTIIRVPYFVLHLPIDDVIPWEDKDHHSLQTQAAFLQ